VIFGFFIFLHRENKPWPPLSPWAARVVSDMLGWRPGRRGRVEGAVAQPVRLAYQPPGSSTFLSEKTSHQQPASSTLLSEQTSTSHQPTEQAASVGALVKINYISSTLLLNCSVASIRNTKVASSSTTTTVFYSKTSYECA
jgi:hypothetical protein